MPTSAESIVAFLQTIDPRITVSGGPVAGKIIKKAMQVEAADFEAIAWLSAKYFERNWNSEFVCKAALLITESSVVNFVKRDLSTTVATTEHPKAIFVAVLDQFFQEGSKETWRPPTSNDIPNDVEVGPGVVFGGNVTLSDGVRIGPNTTIANCTIGKNTVIGANCTIGLAGFGYKKGADGSWIRVPHLGSVEIGNEVEIGSNTCIDRGTLGNTIIEDGVKIDNLVHVAHNVHIKRNALIIANSMLGGSAIIGEQAWISPSVSVINQARIGNSAIVGLGAVVIRDVNVESTVVGNPARAIEKRL